MKRFLARPLPTRAVAIAVVAVLAVGGGTATAAHLITGADVKDGSLGGRDIKAHSLTGRSVKSNSLTGAQIASRSITGTDIRNGSVTGNDIENGSIHLGDLADSAQEVLQGQDGPQGPPGDTGDQGDPGTTLLDPRDNPAVDGDVCCVSWPRDAEITDLTSAAGPLPNAESGRAWRSVVLDPGTYLVTTSFAWSPPNPPATGTTRYGVSRFFLGGRPLEDRGGLSFGRVAMGDSYPATQTASTVIEVQDGTDDQRRLVERVAVIGPDPSPPLELSDDLIVSQVNTM
jgi:hypothetical protein